jgi:hypothetical protein
VIVESPYPDSRSDADPGKAVALTPAAANQVPSHHGW